MRDRTMFFMLLLFSIHKKRCTIIPHNIGWFCRIYADDDQLIIHESVDDVVVIVIDCESGTTTTSWEPDVVHQVTPLPYQLAKH
jgi:hypothetical protein